MILDGENPWSTTTMMGGTFSPAAVSGLEPGWSTVKGLRALPEYGGSRYGHGPLSQHLAQSYIPASGSIRTSKSGSATRKIAAGWDLLQHAPGPVG